MSLEEREGDLFDAADVGALAHRCNCAGAMGAGIAVEFKRRWPAMFDEYRRLCRSGAFGLGDLFVRPDDDLIIYNLGTQRTWRTRASVEAVESAAAKMILDAAGRGIAAVGLPRIGAGLGGLSWPVVRARLTEVADDSGVRLIAHALSAVVSTS